MIQLSDREWKAFKVGEIMDISTGSNISKSLLKEGKIPRITAKATENGVDDFTAPYLRFRLNRNCVSVSFLGNAFYQPYEASYDMKIHSVTIKGTELNRYIGLFIANQFNREFKKFSYGNQLSSTDLPKQNILLPVDANNQPDWSFMEDYMREQEMLILKPAIIRLRKLLKINELGGGGGGGKKSNWKDFGIVDIFTEIKRGKRFKKADHIVGSVPYISSTFLNNGVDEFIENKNGTRTFKNCLTIANSGSVGSTFYHPYNYIASDHVTSLYKKGIDEYVYLFLSTIISRLSEKYSFNREINDSRIKREKILLPIKENGDIDFAYMSLYMRNLEKETLSHTIKYFERKIA